MPVSHFAGLLWEAKAGVHGKRLEQSQNTMLDTPVLLHPIPVAQTLLPKGAEKFSNKPEDTHPRPCTSNNRVLALQSPAGCESLLLSSQSWHEGGGNFVPRSYRNTCIF